MKKSIILIIFITIFYINNFSQGCSDAGFCTIASNADFTPIQDSIIDNQTIRNHSIKFSMGFHLGELSTFLLIPTADLSLQTKNPNSTFNIKLASQLTTGNSITKFGFGDIAITHSYNFLNNKPKHQFILNSGLKIPTNKSIAKNNELELPMVYQSSLGTFDLLLGFNYKFRYKIGVVNVATGYQQPLIHINQNSSFSNPNSILDENNLSDKFIRKGDVFLRFDKVFTIKNNKADFGIGALAIYHIQNDQLQYNNERINISGSKGLTLNVTALINYRLNDKFEFGLNVGMPLLVRDARPDGLTRKTVIAPSLLYRF